MALRFVLADRMLEFQTRKELQKLGEDATKSLHGRCSLGFGFFDETNLIQEVIGRAFLFLPIQSQSKFLKANLDKSGSTSTFQYVPDNGKHFFYFLLDPITRISSLP